MLASIKFARILPLLVFMFIWGLQVFLYWLDPYGFDPIRSYTWFVIIISVVCVMMGYLTYNLTYNIHMKSKTTKRLAPEFLKVDLPKVQQTILFLSMIGSAAIVSLLVILSSYVGGLGSFFEARLDIRHIFVLLFKLSAQDWNVLVSFILYLYNFNYVALLLAGLCFLRSPKLKVIYFLPVVNSLLISLITFQRYLFVQALVIWVFSIYISIFTLPEADRKAAVNRFLKLTFVTMPLTFFILVAVIFLRVDFGEREIDYLLTLRYALNTIYSYITGNIVALEHFLSSFDEWAYGGSVFGSFFKWFARFGIVDPKSVHSVLYEFVSVGPIALNTYTFIRPFYEDFGLFGNLIYCYAWGLSMAYVVQQLLTKFTVLRLHICAFFFFSFFLSFFNFTLLNVTQILYLGVLTWFVNVILLKDKIQFVKSTV